MIKTHNSEYRWYIGEKHRSIGIYTQPNLKKIRIYTLFVKFIHINPSC